MDILISDPEVRVLGSLMEKEITTPDYYPLSLNALTNACNQKSNRDPVVVYDEKTVVRALDGLKEQQLARQSNVSRVPKYEQNFTRPRNLVDREAAIVCVLLLRGPQTVGEIRGRTERLYKFAGLEEVEETLGSLEELGYIRKLPRQPGRKESRYAHLLSGEPETASVGLARPEAAALEVQAENETMARLEEELTVLRKDFEELKADFLDLKSQLE
jgi:uncharacterized protein YceH (UPF0502 family)